MVVAALGETVGETSTVKTVDQLDVNAAKALRDQRNQIRNQVLFELDGVVKVKYGGISITSKTMIKAPTCCGPAVFEELEDHISQEHFGDVLSIKRKTVKDKTYVSFKDSQTKEYTCDIPKVHAAALQQALIDVFENANVSCHYFLLL